MPGTIRQNINTARKDEYDKYMANSTLTKLELHPKF
jgi:hypothetical protein